MNNEDLTEESALLSVERRDGAKSGGGNASMLASTLNLVNAIVGGGVLALPYGFRRCGLILGA